MPFKSLAQEKYLEINHPEIAKRFAAETPNIASLPQHIADIRPQDAGSNAPSPERKMIAMKALINQPR